MSTPAKHKTAKATSRADDCVRTTSRYTHLSRERLFEAMEMVPVVG